MHEAIKRRIAWALKCDVSEVPEEPAEIKVALEARRAVLRAEKLEKVKHGEPIH